MCTKIPGMKSERSLYSIVVSFIIFNNFIHHYMYMYMCVSTSNKFKSKLRNLVKNLIQRTMDWVHFRRQNFYTISLRCYQTWRRCLHVNQDSFSSIITPSMHHTWVIPLTPSFTYRTELMLTGLFEFDTWEYSSKWSIRFGCRPSRLWFLINGVTSIFSIGPLL